MDRHMAANLDHWLTTPPEPVELPLPGDENYPRCSRCGVFLKRDADPALTKVEEYAVHCDGQIHGDMDLTMCGKPGVHDEHDPVMDVAEIQHRICKRCGKDNEEVVA